MPTPMNPNEPIPEFDSQSWRDRVAYITTLTLMALSYNIPAAFNVHPLSAEGKTAAGQILHGALAQLIVHHHGRFFSKN